MHSVSISRPARQLRGLVRFYSQRQVCLHHAVVVHPVAARTSPLLEFIFGDPFQVVRDHPSRFEMSPRTVVVGPQTSCDAHLRLSGTSESFVIMFQPAGLHHLFSLPMQEIADNDQEASAVLGPVVSRLEQRLAECHTFRERVRVADAFLSRRALQLDAVDSISAAADCILSAAGAVRIPQIAADLGLSLRQFERNFVQKIGVRPKLFARMARFEAALNCKARSSSKSWTDVAYDFGYYDQMHLIHDFKDFAGETPKRTLEYLETIFRGVIEAAGSQPSLATADHGQRLIL